MEFITFIWPLMAYLLKWLAVLLLMWIFVETLSFNQKSEGNAKD